VAPPKFLPTRIWQERGHSNGARDIEKTANVGGAYLLWPMGHKHLNSRDRPWAASENGGVFLKTKIFTGFMPQYLPLGSGSDNYLMTKPPLTVIQPMIAQVQPICLCQLFVQSSGTSGSLVLNDCSSFAAATTENQILSMAFSALSAGQMIPISYTTTSGVVVSSVPAGGIFSVYTFPLQTDAPWTDPPFGPLIGGA
jgi:hypothetical protein